MRQNMARSVAAEVIEHDCRTACAENDKDDLKPRL